MPGNIVLINGVTEYYVGDSKMEGLMDYLNRYGQPNRPEKEVKEKMKKEVK